MIKLDLNGSVDGLLDDLNEPRSTNDVADIVVDENEPTFKKGEKKNFDKKVRVNHKINYAEIDQITNHPQFKNYLKKAVSLKKDQNKNNRYGLSNTPYEQINSMGMSLGLPSVSGGTIDYILSIYGDDDDE